ncbi:M28 family peptidase [Bizionia argentinensis JUB59]|uniref:M28 family peptidase n=1 Tax=Bizionia argentinensis JUB59 TaxID=1046627 RepID=G2EAD4_9FLAO|nr:M28 family peptidase [Bizionia argentinensis]EGV44619.1 M28 family peptidase [Bizionia argentinensis JUB59]
MKKLILLLVAISIFSCKVKQENQQVKSDVNITITADEVKETVSFLASNDQMGRDTGSEGLEASASYIENQFKQFDVKPYYDTYRDNFKVQDMDTYNVIGFLEGSDAKLKNEIIIIGAHYDHIGTKAKMVELDSIANGANDNAAGTSSVLAMARYFAAKKTNKRSLMFVLFSAEEMGLLGSKHLANRLKTENANLYTVVNMEMIGVPFQDRDYVAFVTGYGKSNMAEAINGYVGSKLLGESEIAKQYNLFKASDNYPFYEVFKMPSHTISSCDLSNYDFYHHVHDEIDKLDYDHMANLINQLIPGIEKMSNTPTKEIQMNNE